MAREGKGVGDVGSGYCGRIALMLGGRWVVVVVAWIQMVRIVVMVVVVVVGDIGVVGDVR